MDTRRVFKSLDLVMLSTPPSPSIVARGPQYNVLIPYGMGAPEAAPDTTLSSSSATRPCHLVAPPVEGSLTPWSVKPVMVGALPKGLSVRPHVRGSVVVVVVQPSTVTTPDSLSTYYALGAKNESNNEDALGPCPEEAYSSASA